MVETTRCMIIGAGPIKSDLVFKEFNPKDFYVICADAGYETALKYGIKPDYIVGDFDSATTMPTLDNNVKVLPINKDFTDTMFAAMEGVKKGYKHFVLVGCSGGERCDHTIANYNVMVYLSKKGCSPVMVDEICKTFLLSGSKLRISDQKDSIVSVFPFGSNTCTVSYHGLKFPMKYNDLLVGDSLMGVSNSIISDKAEIIVHAGFAIVIVFN